MFGDPIPAEKLTELDATAWELYHVEEDWAENHNVAEQHRDKLIEMIGMWYVEAGRYQVMPVDGRGVTRFAEERPQLTVGRTSYTFYRGTQSVPPAAGPQILNRTHTITAEVEIPEGGAEGALLSFGGNDGGFSFYMKDGKLHHVHNYVARDFLHVESKDSVPTGKHELRFEFEVTGEPDIRGGKGTPGRAQLYVDGELVGQEEYPHTTPLSMGLTGGWTVGADPGAPAAPFYESPFEFSGKVDRVTVDVSGDVIKDDEADFKRLMARQ